MDDEDDPMPFATTTLAAQIERADCDLLTESVDAILQARPEADVMICPLAGGLATYSGVGSPLNKVAGLGFAGPVDEIDLERVEGFYAERGAPVQVELASLADPSVGAMLTTRGYSLVGFENVSGRKLSQEDVPPSNELNTIVLTVCDESDFDAWLHTVVEGFASPDVEGVPSHESFPREALEQVIRDMSGGPNFVRYIARRDGEPAGGGSMRVGDGIVQMCGAATLPAHRRQGIQTALLYRRLADAVKAGCELAVVTTQPGSKSQENVQRNGFELMYTRAIMVLAPPT
jgi:GNAT superfamily N-acetyltransferase